MEKFMTGEGITSPVNIAEQSADIYITRAEVSEMIREALDNLRVYVLESDITSAQQRVATITEQSIF